MKDYEKKYKEALERAKKYKLKEDLIITQDIFPELKYSEDEIIRKEIISAIKEDWPGHKDWIAWLEKQGEQKPTAEEVLIKAGLKLYKDGNQWCVLVGDNIQEGVCGFGDTIEDALYSFLKNVCKTKQKPVEWSVEDNNCLSTIIANFSKCAGKSVSKDEWMRCNDFLNSLKDRVQPQPKQEWSEEDEEELKIALDTLEKAGQHSSATWLKNVCLVPQSTWKPSKGQLECLGYAIEKAEKDWSPLTNNRIYLTLKALKEQLLELRGSKV